MVFPCLVTIIMLDGIFRFLAHIPCPFLPFPGVAKSSRHGVDELVDQGVAQGFLGIPKGVT